MKTVTKLKKYIYKQTFNPGILGIFLNPFYFSRKDLYYNISQISKNVTGKILDVGCGQKPYRSLFSYSEYIGIDIEQSGHSHTYEEIDFYYDGKTFPFPDKSFDNAICSQVFEHVFNPKEFLEEIKRSLKESGSLLLTVPFVWDEHEQPYDYGRYSSFGLKNILEECGFEVITLKKSVTGIKAITQLIMGYLFKIFYTKNIYLNYLINIIVISPIAIMGLFLYKILPANTDLYLDNIVLARKR